MKTEVSGQTASLFTAIAGSLQYNLTHTSEIWAPTQKIFKLLSNTRQEKS